MSTARLGSFADCVFSIAATLLVLNIHVPSPGGGQSLAHELAAQWPAYTAYAISFLTIGIIWINHHAMVSRLKTVDRAILTLNVVLLMCIGFLPFSTALLATYLKAGHGQVLAAAVYAGSFLVMTAVFALNNHHILFSEGDRLARKLSVEKRRQILTRGAFGVAPYAVAMAIAPISAYATLLICGAVAVFYALPVSSAGLGAT